MREGDLYRAIGEYKRFVYFHPGEPEVDAARFSIGLAYLRGGQMEAAADHYRELFALYRKLPAREGLAAEAALQVGYASYLAGDLTGARLELSGWLARAPPGPSPSRQRAKYLLGWAALSSGDTAAALELFGGLDELPGRLSLLEATRSLDQLPYRSPALAAMLSIVPGGGHLYLGQPGIALGAFAWNALFGFATYDAFRRGDIGVGLVLAAFEALWYFGTVFGAVSGAHKHNRDLRLNALEELRARFDDRPESWPPSPPLR